MIGRAPQCALVLDHPSVSALHAEVRGTSEGVHLVDLNSKNGTFIVGCRVGFGGVSPARARADVLPLRVPGAPVRAAWPELTTDFDLQLPECPLGRGASSARRILMARHFDADPTVPLAGERPSVRGGRIEVVGEARSMVVGAERVVMGRAPQCGLVLDDPSVSALHAEARGTSEGVHLVDLNSRNGTFVGGNRVVDLYLNTPTEFTCGSRRLRFAPLGTLDVQPDTAEVTRFGRLVATTRPMREALERLRKLAASDLPMVLTGEMGTGKELAARAVTRRALAAQSPFVPDLARRCRKTCWRTSSSGMCAEPSQGRIPRPPGPVRRSRRRHAPLRRDLER